MAGRNYELIACGLGGHELVGEDAAEVRQQDALFAREGDPPSVRWLRCLRCDSWVTRPVPEHSAQPHPPAREEIQLPLRGQALRDRYVLRLIALDRVLHFTILTILAVAIFLITRNQNQVRGTFYRVLSDLQGGVRGPSSGGHGLVHDVSRVLSLQSRQLDVVGLVILGYALLEGLEAIGLWLGKRWAEYLTFIATTLLLPLEVYELTSTVSVLKMVTFLINLAVVVYLIYAKRLFGVRGGGAADRRERERDSGWDAVERATPWEIRSPVADLSASP